MKIALRILSAAMLLLVMAILFVAFAITIFPWGYAHLLTSILSITYMVIGIKKTKLLMTDIFAGVVLSGISALAVIPQLSMSNLPFTPSLYIFVSLSLGICLSFLLWRVSR